MGSSRWSDEFYNEREAYRAATGASAFGYDEALRKGPASAWRTHPKMDPFEVKLRESRDSEAHPTSKAVAVLFDVTGSMGGIPVVLQKKLSNLMGLLVNRSYLEHPQILFGAIGDATCDRAPLQIGQFESGIEMDDDLSRFFLEGGGGGQQTESYELAAYFMARHTAMDCLEKRGEKGYLFIIGDEAYYPRVKRAEVERVIGDRPQSDIWTKDIFAELQRKFEVFYLIPTQASNGGDVGIRRAWQAILGQNVLQLEDPNAVCEAIALAIGLCEGKVDLDAGVGDLRDMGTAAATASAVGRAVATLAKRVRVRRVGSDGPRLLGWGRR